jgi:hypothetical protein
LDNVPIKLFILLLYVRITKYWDLFKNLRIGGLQGSRHIY